MRTIIQFLRSESFIFIAVLCVLIGQILHTAYLFETLRIADLSFSIGAYDFKVLNWLHGVICAAAIEAAMLMFLINGKKSASKIYALASFAVNILYYQAWENSIPQMVASTLVSAMLSGSIWFFSDLFADKIMAMDEAEADLKDNMLSMSDLDVREVRTAMHR